MSINPRPDHLNKSCRYGFGSPWGWSGSNTAAVPGCGQRKQSFSSSPSIPPALPLAFLFSCSHWAGRRNVFSSYITIVVSHRDTVMHLDNFSTLMSPLIVILGNLEGLEKMALKRKNSIPVLVLKTESLDYLVSTTWELTRNANSLAPYHSYWRRTHGGQTRQPV
jgi:hypothetical protein